MGHMEDFSAEVVPELREGEVIYAQVRVEWVGSRILDADENRSKAWGKMS